MKMLPKFLDSFKEAKSRWRALNFLVRVRPFLKRCLLGLTYNVPIALVFLLLAAFSYRVSHEVDFYVMPYQEGFLCLSYGPVFNILTFLHGLLNLWMITCCLIQVYLRQWQKLTILVCLIFAAQYTADSLNHLYWTHHLKC